MCVCVGVRGCVHKFECLLLVSICRVISMLALSYLLTPSLG